MSRTLTRSLIAVAAVAALAMAFIHWRRSPGTQIPGWATCEQPMAGAEEVVALDESLPPVTTEEVAALDAPTDLTTRPGDDALYVSERGGRLLRLLPEEAPEELLEVETVLEKERGFLGITFSPDGEYLYTNHTDAEGTNRVVAHAIDAEGHLSAATEILNIPQRRANHNANGLVFGPDGALYIGVGDGGVDPHPSGAYEQGDPERAAQDLSSLHGKILRIIPDPVAGGYRIPDDNPFSGDPAAAGEVWAFGLRNPWRFSFDRETQDLWVGDVGQYCFEEINLRSFADAAGTNFGWSAFEGFAVHHDDDEAPGHVLPLHAYPRGDGSAETPLQCAVIGGHVYRGDALPDLVGTYLFGDFCSGDVRALRTRDGAVDVSVLVADIGSIQSMAEDSDGELYVLTTTAVHRLVQPPGVAGPGPLQRSRSR